MIGGMATSAVTLRRRVVAAPAGPVAGLLALVSIACAASAYALHRYVQARTTIPVDLDTTDLVFATTFPVVAALIVLTQPRNRVGWLLLTTCLMGPYLLAGQVGAQTLLPGAPPPLASMAIWVSIWGYLPYLVVWGLVPLHFPDGTLPSPRWRPVRLVAVSLIAVEGLARMFAPIESDTAHQLANPLGVHGAEWLNVVTLAASILVVYGCGAVGVAAIWVRLRNAAGVERAQLLWLLVGAVALVGSTVVGAAVGGQGANIGMGVGLVALILAIGVAVVRHRLFDITTALSRTVVYGALTACLLVAYVAVLAGVQAIAPGRRFAYFAIAVVALVVAAARDQMQRLMERLLFGLRRDPYAVLSQVQGRLDLATGPMDALAQAAEGLRSALKLPYVAVAGADDRLAPVESGAVPSAADAMERVPLRIGADDLGVLTVAHRRPGERFGTGERAAINDVAQRATTLLSQAALMHDLQRSRERLVVAREEERRRLRRDLHDGLGPQLAAMAMQLDTMAAELETTQPEQAARATRLREQLRSTVAEVRHVVDDLRPAAVDELGLTDAVRQLAAPYGDTMVVDAEDLPALSAATEVAAYRIVAEAVTNAMRHAEAERCLVRLDHDGRWLVVEVHDDGTGLDPSARPGVGLQSMRERASEVGGRFEVRTGPDGTTVTARLPLEAA